MPAKPRVGRVWVVPGPGGQLDDPGTHRVVHRKPGPDAVALIKRGRETWSEVAPAAASRTVPPPSPPPPAIGAPAGVCMAYRPVSRRAGSQAWLRGW